jgi:hypothetical protein
MTINLKGVTSCLGYAQDATISAASNLPSIPTKDKQGNKQQPTIAAIIVHGQAARWRDDGTAPTASVGMYLPADTPFVYDGDLNAIQFIEVTSGAELNVSYYA